MTTIASRDQEINAWVQVGVQPAMRGGALYGVPFGAKDIIETRGLATEYGSPVYSGRIGIEDADIVSALKSRGAVLLGKTQTTAFAYITPAPTRNPHNLNHTPGGKFERFGSGSRRRHGAVGARHTDEGLGAQACLLLRRHRLQANLRGPSR